MIEDVKKNMSRAWKKFAARHRKMIGLWILMGIMFAAGAVYVFMDFAADAQASGMMPGSLGDWSVGHLFTFVINLLFWEALIIGIPVLITFVAIYMLWWKTIPLHEREEYERAKLFHSSEGTKGSSGVSLFFYILFMVKVYMDGNWNLPISHWSFDYLINSVLWIILVVVVFVGIPMLLGGLWYFSTLKEGGSDDEKPFRTHPCKPKPWHQETTTPSSADRQTPEIHASPNPASEKPEK